MGLVTTNTCLYLWGCYQILSITRTSSSTTTGWSKYMQEMDQSNVLWLSLPAVQARGEGTWWSRTRGEVLTKLCTWLRFSRSIRFHWNDSSQLYSWLPQSYVTAWREHVWNSVASTIISCCDYVTRVCGQLIRLQVLRVKFKTGFLRHEISARFARPSQMWCTCHL